MGGLEILTISIIIGGVLGYYFRSKKIKPILGVILGVFGAAVMGYLLTEMVYRSTFTIPLFAIIGSWFFNFIAARFVK
ncbi:MAG: hypothetical protein CMB80_16140 [Flammeovirgaceae bacterium]|nr:hypothetical protein [Flammeovirgaceae bacterium]MBE62863.1 hypothetical protein [Flammeovirgaceae bacterium]MBR11274.1 hypothetical protein [Rickettsiales bacterium]MBR11514.1 hypothetical protein [Rickettsiales bacterium]|tara:strand:+ start:2648 stop:2881 length:234 start_codon:yes stop_codon:yes gene_type:complete